MSFKKTLNIAKIMKAVIIDSFGGPNVMQVRHVDIPSISDNEVKVKIKSAGVNPVDTYIREGAYLNLPELPFTPGKDGSGIVDAVGKGICGLELGQRVFISSRKGGKHGTYAEYAVADQKDVFPLSDRLTFDQGAALGIPYFTAFRALILKAQATAKETILVHGASGAVGLAAVQMAKAFHMNVIGTAGTPEGMQLVRNNGADHVLCHKDKNYLEAVMELTQNKGVDVVIEMLANVNLNKDLQILSRNGRVMVVGCRGTVSINPRQMMGPETKIMGVALMNSTDEEWEQISKAILKGMQDGWVKPVIDKKYKLEQTSESHHDIINSKGAKGKLILCVDPVET